MCPNRGKEQVIIKRKFKFNFSTLKKNNSKVYRCTEYRTKNKCKSFIILNEKKEIIELLKILWTNTYQLKIKKINWFP